jgi:CrcB protein
VAVIAIAVALGGAVGAVLRHLVSLRLNRPGFPWGTLAVNVAGSFLLGAVFGRTSPEVAALVGTGFCGALTTYSTFALEVVGLPARRAVAYAAVSVVAGLAAAALGALL